MSDVLDLARVRINDAIASISGDILTDTQPFTQSMANAAWQKLQKFLANLGYSRSKNRVVLSGFPVCGSIDPSDEAFLSWTTYFDGASFWVPPDVGLLPQDFILPLKIAERMNGSNQIFFPMANCLDGLPGGVKQPCNGFWNWRNDQIYMPGSQNVMDLQILYAAFLPDFVNLFDGTPWYTLPVPIMRSTSALANYIAAEASKPRADADAASFTADAEQDARLIFNVEVGMKQRVTTARRPLRPQLESYYNGLVSSV